MLRWLGRDENRKARRFIAWLALSVAIALGVSVGRGVTESAFAHGWNSLPWVARDNQWVACRTAPTLEERFGACAARAEDRGERTDNRAIAYAAMGDVVLGDDPIAAAGRYEQAIALNPSNINHHVQRASAMLTLGDVTEAEASLAAASAIDPTDFGVQWMQAEYWLQTGAYTQAAQRYADVIAGLDGYDARLQRRHAEDQREGRAYQGARTLLEPRLRATLLLWRATALFQSGHREAAVRERDAAIAANPEALTELNYMCGHYAAFSQNRTAPMVLCDTAVAFSPAQIAPRLHRAIASLRASAWNNAIADSEHVITATTQTDHTPPDITTEEGRARETRRAMDNGFRAQALYARGIARQHLGQHALGERDIAEAVATNSSVSAFFETLRRELDRQTAAALPLRPRLAP